MNKSAYISVRIEPDVKTETDSILKSLGISATEAISMFYNQINMRRGLPFPVEIPNAATMKTINDAWAGINIHKVNSVEELRAEIEAD
ncbi:MAG: type II toxin-antitoxin system RelB/DinJ family antitoxin [Anaerolineae bacterium]|nr:type II toxin-antitoxin system RelB/DinJ family antitoxin [Anaerolineae bacterium]